MAEIPSRTRIAISVKCPLCEKPLSAWAEIIRVDDKPAHLVDSVTLRITNVEIEQGPFLLHMEDHHGGSIPNSLG